MSQYPIRAVTEMTGVAPTTLRAWERRYGLLKPERTPKGHRLYSMEDIELVREVVGLLKSGRTISDAIRQLRDGGPEREQVADAYWSVAHQRMMAAIESYDERRLESVYNDALALYPVDIVTNELLIPVLSLLGERWEVRSAGIAEEHFFSSFLRNKLGARLHHESRGGRGRRLLVACIGGEYHELGLMLFSLSLLGHGYRLLYLGSDFPVTQIDAVLNKAEVDGVVLSVTDENLITDEVLELIQELTTNLPQPLFLGGVASDEIEKRIEPTGALSLGVDFDHALSVLQRIVPAYGAMSK